MNRLLCLLALAALPYPAAAQELIRPGEKISVLLHWWYNDQWWPEEQYEFWISGDGRLGVTENFRGDRRDATELTLRWRQERVQDETERGVTVTNWFGNGDAVLPSERWVGVFGGGGWTRFNGLSGDLAEAVFQTHRGEYWGNSRRALFGYDEAGRLDSLVHQDWGTWSGQWEDDDRLLYENDAAGNLTAYEVHDRVDGAWIPVRRRTNTYSAEGKPVSVVAFDWDAEGRTWSRKQRDSTAYDERGRIVFFVSQTWQDAWVDQRRTTTRYPAEDSSLTFFEDLTNGSSSVDARYERKTAERSDIRTYGFLDGVWKTSSWIWTTFGSDGRPLELQELQWTGTGWRPGRRSIYTYSSLTAAPGEEQGPPHQVALAVFPNPILGSGTIHVVMPVPAEAAIELVDLLGRSIRTLHRGPLPVGDTVFGLDAYGLATGVYFVRLLAQGEVHTASVVVAR